MSIENNALTMEEFEEMEHLTEAVAESVGPHDIDASFLDGFLTGWALLPEPPGHRAWIQAVFSKDGKPIPETDDFKKLRKLLMKRYKEINEQLKNSQVIDPVRFEPETEELLSESLEEQLSYLSPFVNGLYSAIYDIPNNLDFNDVDSVYPLVVGTSNLESILGKPQNEDGEEVEETAVTYEDFYDALEAIVTNVAVMANDMKGYPLPPDIEEKLAEEESSEN